jgi:hypothetical protein
MVAVPADASGSAATPGVRAILDAARATIRSDPTLWLLGALGFCVRGGVVLLLLPILWVPTPVLLSIFLAPYLSSSGLSAEAVPALAVSGVVAIALVVAAVTVAAFVDVAAFERVAANRATTALRGEHAPRRVEGRSRTTAALGLISLSLLGLVPIVAALIPLVARINAVATSELELPTQLDTPFVVTVLGRVAPGVVLFIAIVVVVELFVTLASRELLATRFGLRGNLSSIGPLTALTLGAGRIARHPGRTLAVWLLAWLVTLAGIAAGIAALTLSWDLVRQVLFSTVEDSPSGALWGIGIRFVAVAIFGAIWVGGVTLCGIASSLRGALWTVQSLE